MLVRGLTAVTDSMGDEDACADIPNGQFQTVFRFSPCDMGLRIEYKNLDSKEIEKFAKIFMSHLVNKIVLQQILRQLTQ